MSAQTCNRGSIVLALALLVSACSVYRVDVRQGNYIDPTRVEQVKPGMSHDQVRFLLGPPLVDDPFHHDRWDYVFTFESGVLGDAMIRREVVVLFDGEKVREVKSVQ